MSVISFKKCWKPGMEAKITWSFFKVSCQIHSIVHVDYINKPSTAGNSPTKNTAVRTIKLYNKNESAFN